MATEHADDDAVYAKVAWRIIPFLFVCYLFNYIDRVNVGFAKLQMLDDLGMSEAVYGLGAGIFFIGYLICGTPSNLMLERYGARRWIGLMMVAWGLVSASLMFVLTPGGFYTLRFLTGAAEAGFFPGIVLYLTRWFPRSRHGRVMTVFMAAIPVSGVIGGPISGWMLGYFAAGQGGLAAWQWLFLLQGLPTVLLGMSVWYVLSDGIGEARWLDADEKRRLEDALAQDDRTRFPAAAARLRDALAEPGIWMLGLLYFCIQSGVYAINFWLPTIIKASGEDDPLMIGLLSAVPYGAAVMFMVAMGRSADRREERRLHLAASLGIGALGLLIAAMMPANAALSLLGMTMAAMGALTGLPLFWPLTTRHLSATAAAGGLALINSIGQTAGFASPYFVGWVRDASGGTDAALYALAMALAIGVVLALRSSDAVANR